MSVLSLKSRTVDRGKESRLRAIALLPLLLTLAACNAHIHYRGPEAEPPPASMRPVAYITNPELRHEARIIKESQLYRLSANPAAPERITLQPLLHHGGCGNGLIALMFTLGIVPVSLPDVYTLNYILQDASGTHQLSYVLNLEYTVSLWENFYIFTNDDEELGHALRAQVVNAGATGMAANAPLPSPYAR